jgi:hypothetical protein
MDHFPKFLYHATESPCLVDSVAEMTALGPGWYETPDTDQWVLDTSGIPLGGMSVEKKASVHPPTVGRSGR